MRACVRVRFVSGVQHCRGTADRISADFSGFTDSRFLSLTRRKFRRVSELWPGFHCASRGAHLRTTVDQFPHMSRAISGFIKPPICLNSFDPLTRVSRHVPALFRFDSLGARAAPVADDGLQTLHFAACPRHGAGMSPRHERTMSRRRRRQCARRLFMPRMCALTAFVRSSSPPRRPGGIPPSPGVFMWQSAELTG